MTCRNSLLIVIVLLFGATGCRTKPQQIYDRQLLPGQTALRKITNPAEIPDFTTACSNLTDLKKAITNSLDYLSKPSSNGFFPCGEITHARAVASLRAFNELLDSGLAGSRLNAAIRSKFDVYISVGCDDEGTVLFTGYYTPIFDGSPVRTERFQYPLYRQPDDLVKGLNGAILGQRGPDGQIRQYPSRAEIESSGMLKGNELIWLGNPFEVYIAHVQGSAKIKTPDGQLITVGYAANNGHEYCRIDKELIKDGKITRNQMSLAAMIDFFKTHLDEVNKYTWQNPRYVFFRIEQGQPRGSLNAPVIPMRTIATDKSIFPRACLAYILTPLHQTTDSQIAKRSHRVFVLDQDTGGAIRAAGRCDIYMGQGPAAGRLAGQTYQEGRLYYLFLKP